MNGDDPKLVMARRIADTACEPIKAPRHSSPWEASYRSALAAILETQRRDAELADRFFVQDAFRFELGGSIATAIRTGTHYGKAEQ